MTALLFAEIVTGASGQRIAVGVERRHRHADRAQAPVLAIDALSSTAERSVTIFGVMKISSSVRLVLRDLFLNRLPTTGMSPSSGTLLTWCARLREDAADHDRAAVLDQHLGLHLLGVDRRAGRGQFVPTLSLLTSGP
jgi:hypothetical protein